MVCNVDCLQTYKEPVIFSILQTSFHHLFVPNVVQGMLFTLKALSWILVGGVRASWLARSTLEQAVQGTGEFNAGGNLVMD